MKRTNLILKLCLLLIFPVISQEDTLFLTLENTWELAINNNLKQKSQLLDQLIAEKQLSAAWTQLYPQMNAGIDVRYNIERPIFLLPGETVDKPGEVVLAKLGSDFGGYPTLSVNQVIFDASLFSELKIIKERNKTSVLETEVTKRQIKLHATKSFFNVFINRERMKQLQNAKERLQNTYDRINTKVKAELIHSIELERVQLAIIKNKADLNKASQSLELSETMLKYALFIAPDQDFELIAPLIEPDNLNTDYMDLHRHGFDLSQLPETQLLKHNIHVSNLRINQQRRKNLPTVSLYGNIGAITLGDNYEIIGKDPSTWNFMSYIGLKAQWRLNSLIDNRHIVPQLRLKSMQSELQLKDQERQIEISVINSMNQLTNRLEDYRINLQLEAFAQKELDYLQVRFESDLTSVKDVIEADEKLSELQRETLVAYYNYLSSKFELILSRGG